MGHQLHPSHLVDTDLTGGAPIVSDACRRRGIISFGDVLIGSGFGCGRREASPEPAQPRPAEGHPASPYVRTRKPDQPPAAALPHRELFGKEGACPRPGLACTVAASQQPGVP